MGLHSEFTSLNSQPITINQTGGMPWTCTTLPCSRSALISTQARLAGPVGIPRNWSARQELHLQPPGFESGASCSLGYTRVLAHGEQMVLPVRLALTLSGV